jgi:hypothetical protein
LTLPTFEIICQIVFSLPIVAEPEELSVHPLIKARVGAVVDLVDSDEIDSISDCSAELVEGDLIMRGRVVPIARRGLRPVPG